MDPWLTSHLVCPRDRRPVELKGDRLICPDGHEYAVVDGVPTTFQTPLSGHFSPVFAVVPIGARVFV